MQQTDFNGCCCLGWIVISCYSLSNANINSEPDSVSLGYVIFVELQFLLPTSTKVCNPLLLRVGGEVEMVNLYLASSYVYPCID